MTLEQDIGELAMNLMDDIRDAFVEPPRVSEALLVVAVEGSDNEGDECSGTFYSCTASAHWKILGLMESARLAADDTDVADLDT